MSTICGPGYLWRLIDPPPGDEMQAEIHRLIRVLHDQAYDDWMETK